VAYFIRIAHEDFGEAARMSAHGDSGFRIPDSGFKMEAPDEKHATHPESGI